MSLSQEHDIDPRRLELASDPHRPAYHFLAPANWMNDPNGTIFWQGRYHIFYQYNPNGAFHGTIHWGHASSADLVHWEDHPIALAPTPGAADREQCYSGAAFVTREGAPAFIYHGVPDGICQATSDDDLLVAWDKHPANPIIPTPGPTDPYRIGGAPCAWIEEDTYYALTGNSGATPPDAAYLFRSSDLSHWEYLHPFYEGGRFTDWGEDCGCPDFFRLGDRHVLFFTSHPHGAQYYTGTYVDHKFTPEYHRRLAYGAAGRPGVYNEGLTLLDDQGRRILFGRIHEARYGYAQRAAGWAGIFALPIALSPAEDGGLLMAPVPELEILRGTRQSVTDLPLADSTVVLDGIAGDQLEIRATFAWDDAEEFGLNIRSSPDGQEQTQIRFNANPWHTHRAPKELQPLRELILDITRSSISAEVSNRDSERCSFGLPYGELLELRVFVDRSVVEVFANGRHYLAKRIYPDRRDSLGVEFFARGGSARLVSLDAWPMDAIWPVA